MEGKIKYSTLRWLWTLLIVICLIFASGAVIGTMHLGVVYMMEIFLGISGIIIFKPQIEKKQVYFPLIYTLVNIFNFILLSDITAGSIDSFLKGMIVFGALFFCSTITTRTGFMNMFFNVMVAEAIYSLSLWVLNFLNIRPFFRMVPFTYLRYFISGLYVYGFKNILVPVQSIAVSGGFSRNFGIFWEPGAHQGYLTLALLWMIVNSESIHGFKWKFCVLFIALLSTASTTGLLCAIVIMLVYFIKNSPNGRVTRSQLLFLVVMIFLGKAILTSPAVVEKFSDNTQGSIAVRSNDILTSLKFTIQRPLFGYGAESTLKTSLLRDEGVTHNSAGLLIMSLNYGIPFTIYMFYLLCKQLLMRNRNLVIGVLAVAIVLACMLTEHFMTKHLIMFMMFHLTDLVIEEMK